MTEKEFEKLKVGDKVWIFVGKPKKTFVIAKQKDIGSDILSVQVDDGGFHPAYVAEYVFLTKSEALEAEIKREEKIVENNERGIEKAKERIDRYKSELAKAKEEEAEKKEKPWKVVYALGGLRATQYATPRDPIYSECSTEAEAYGEVAKYHYEKAYEAVRDFAKCITKKEEQNENTDRN